MTYSVENSKLVNVTIYDNIIKYILMNYILEGIKSKETLEHVQFAP